MSNKKFPVRLAFHLLGITLLALGIALNMKSSLGSLCFDILLINLAEITNLHYYIINALIGLLIILIFFLTTKKISLFFSLIFVFLLGFLVDFIILLLPDIDNILFKIIYGILGILTYSLGLSFLISTKFSPTAYDLIFVFLIQKTKNKVVAKIIQDGSSLILAIIIGLFLTRPFNQISYFTLIGFATIGFLTNFFIKYLGMEENNVRKNKSK